MEFIRKVSLVAATFVLAAATGQYMQQNAPKRAPLGADRPTMNSGLSVMTRIGGLAAATRPASTAALPALLRDSDKVPMLTARAPMLPAPRAGEDPYPRRARTCGPHLALQPMAGALLRLHLSAPCHPGQRVVIRHAGLAFTGRTTGSGTIRTALPALTPEATVSVTFPGGQTVMAKTRVPDAGRYRRIAVQWVSTDGFSLHGPADLSTSRGARGTPAGSPSLRGPVSGGYLMRLGDRKVRQPMLAQVYTYPIGKAAGVRLALEAAVTPATCGREVLGQTLHTRHAAAPLVTDLSIQMPGCDSIGGFVQLGGLVTPLRVASN